MPRYHFDLVDHVTVEDHGGQLFTDDGAAARAADDLAQQIFEVRPELRGKGYSVLVTDARGLEVHRAPVRENAEQDMHRRSAE
jgi:Bacteriophage Lambda NinG protein